MAILKMPEKCHYSLTGDWKSKANFSLLCTEDICVWDLKINIKKENGFSFMLTSRHVFFVFFFLNRTYILIKPPIFSSELKCWNFFFFMFYHLHRDPLKQNQKIHLHLFIYLFVCSFIHGFMNDLADFC